METAVQAVKRWNQVRAKLRKQAVTGTDPIKLRLARRILPGPDWPLHRPDQRLCCALCARRSHVA